MLEWGNTLIFALIFNKTFHEFQLVLSPLNNKIVIFKEHLYKKKMPPILTTQSFYICTEKWIQNFLGASEKIIIYLLTFKHVK